MHNKLSLKISDHLFSSLFKTTSLTIANTRQYQGGPLFCISKNLYKQLELYHIIRIFDWNESSWHITTITWTHMHDL